jgi:MFS family permease
MADWFRFLFGNKRLLNFGFLFNFFSSFGQTFFISLFVPYWIKELGITNASFGSMYAIVTLISAGLLTITGKYIDRLSLKKFSLIVFSGLMLSVLFLSQAKSIVVLVMGLLLVRWFGQGLMTHTSSTGIAKYFESNRGKALGFTALGHPAGQFLLPFIMIPLIMHTSWSLSLIYMVIAASIVVIPALMAIKRVTSFEPNLAFKENSKNTSNENYLLTLRFWKIAVNAFAIPFLATAIFLYQYTIGQNKGFTTSWVAFSFAFYAVFSAIALLLSGNLVDKYGGVKLFPLYLFPALLGIVLMPIIDNKWVFPVFYALLGFSSGLGSTIKTAVQAEIYGTQNLGKIRSYFSTILVISTAVGPPVFGYLLDKQYTLNHILAMAAVFVVIAIFLSFRIKTIEV